MYLLQTIPRYRQTTRLNSSGKINWVYRHYPLPFHNPGAQKQAEASECVAELGDNEKFWRFTNTIFEQTRGGGQGFPLEKLSPLAKQVGINQGAFQKCLDSGKYANKVQQQLNDGKRAGITGTPGNILYNMRSGEVIAVTGARPYEQLLQAAQKLMQTNAQ